jgi:hypothetical protein
MYTLVVKGARRATLAVHKLESDADLRELIAAYHALGYTSDVLIVVKGSEEKAA